MPSSYRFSLTKQNFLKVKLVLQTPVQYTCPPGQAFDGLYTREEWGNCTGSGENVYWKYNSSSPLPDCIGNYQYPLWNDSPVWVFWAQMRFYKILSFIISFQLTAIMTSHQSLLILLPTFRKPWTTQDRFTNNTIISTFISTVRCSYSQSIQGSIQSIQSIQSTYRFDCSNLFNMALTDQTKMKINESEWIWMNVDEIGCNWM